METSKAEESPQRPPRAVAGWCKNYNGFANNETCKAGMNYKTVAGSETGWINILPCTKPVSCVSCPKMEKPTEAEVAAWEEYTKGRFQMIMTARRAIIQTGLKGGSIECPSCKGALYFSIASNGHVHAKCSAEDCLSWME
ncbi:hypothetical protein [Methylobacterium sp. 1030]|uniref:hypothetical protein n=1 Tax=Methylobacterium sp. 1030 TaxID=3156404 RepID=UPI00339383A3